MLGFKRCLAHLLFMCTLVSAFRHGATLMPNKSVKIFREVSSYNFPAFFHSQHAQQVIEVKFYNLKKEKEDEEQYKSGDLPPWEIDMLILTEDDLKIIKLDRDVRNDFRLPSDTDGMSWNSIYVSDITVHPDIEQFSLDEVLTKNLNQSLISSFKLSPENDIVQHPFESPGTYCIIASFNFPHNDTVANVGITFRDPHGELSREDYKYMHFYFMLSIIYFVSSLLYCYYVFYKVINQSDENHTSANTKHSFQAGTIQLRILIYMFGNSLYYFLATSHFYKLNMDDPYNPGFMGTFLRFASRILATVLSNWVLYNLVLMSLGFLFASRPSNPQIPMYMFRKSLSSLLAAIRLYQMELDGSSFTDMFLRFGIQILAAVCFCSALSSLLSMTSGHLLSSLRTNEQLLLSIREAVIGNVMQGSVSAYMLTYHDGWGEIGDLFSNVKLLVFFFYFLYFSVRTYSELRLHGRSSAANRFMATAVLILSPIVYDGFICPHYPSFLSEVAWSMKRFRSDRHTLSFPSLSDLVLSIKNSRNFRHSIHLLATLLTAVLWKDTVVDSGKVVKAE
ncbi:unnamed protein product [Kuraishia capsulata CBS 1993]|uniref:Intimal thickness related receptor IRP domain-containing protein n=1 Tax=Kuraishia capsulata CBS 1993 TaxID=1382522 RepID=W6MN39_9ASCO|nr:uncharacterized protein KUCA_T00004015001 [Kuraishia capsulata CBS 1993]CDK28034.1 unnamed protein product [Kuraishia capsulata CBS 1993]